MLDMINETLINSLRMVCIAGLPPKACSQDRSAEDQVFTSSEMEKARGK